MHVWKPHTTRAHAISTIHEEGRKSTEVLLLITHEKVVCNKDIVRM